MSLNRMIVCVIVLLTWSSRVLPDDDVHARLDAFGRELGNFKSIPGQNQNAIWFPTEFFVESSLSKGDKTRAAAERDYEYLRGYHIFTVQRKRFHTDGTASYANELDVRRAAVLQLPNGKQIQPLVKGPPLVSAFVAGLTRITTVEGNEGALNTHFLLFPATTPDGRSNFDISKQSKLVLVLKADRQFKEMTFEWRTPFEALNPRTPCASCREPLSSQWLYCPCCGTRAAAANHEVLRIRLQPKDK